MNPRTAILTLEVLTDLPLSEIRKIAAICLLKDLEDATGVIVPVVQVQANRPSGERGRKRKPGK